MNYGHKQKILQYDMYLEQPLKAGSAKRIHWNFTLSVINNSPSNRQQDSGH